MRQQKILRLPTKTKLYLKVNIKSTCAQSCSTLCDPMGCSPPGSSVHGIFQKRTLEWVAIFFFKGSSQPRDWTCVLCIFCIGSSILYYWATTEVKYQESYLSYGFIATDETHSPSQLCIIYGNRLSNKVMTPSKLLHHMETKHFALKNKLWSFSKWKTSKQQQKNTPWTRRTDFIKCVCAEGIVLRG